MSYLKDVTPVLRKAYLDRFALLKVSGKAIPFFDETVPGGVVPDAYVIITDQNSLDISSKTEYQTLNDITLRIETKFPLGSGGKLLSEQIAGQILKELTEERLDLSPDFELWSTEVESNRSSKLISTNAYYTKILIISHKIKQTDN